MGRREYYITRVQNRELQTSLSFSLFVFIPLMLEIFRKKRNCSVLGMDLFLGFLRLIIFPFDSSHKLNSFNLKLTISHLLRRTILSISVNRSLMPPSCEKTCLLSHRTYFIEILFNFVDQIGSRIRKLFAHFQCLKSTEYHDRSTY